MTYDTILPGCLVCLSKVKKETNCLLFVGKGITDIPLQADQVVCCASVLSEATLAPVEDSLLLQVPDQALIDHSFQDFAQAASECYGSITQWVRVILARFGDGDNWGSPPLGWKVPRYPYTIKDILQDHKWLFREVLQEDIVDAIGSRGSWLGLQDCSSKISKSEAFVVYLCVLGFKIEVFLLGLLFDLKEFLWIVCWGRIACKSRSMLIYGYI